MLCHCLPTPSHTSHLFRGLGDRDFKMASLLTCEPELSCITLLPGQDAFSIFATDGLWCVVEDAHAVAEVQAVLRQVSAGGADLQQGRVKITLNGIGCALCMRFVGEWCVVKDAHAVAEAE